MTKGTPTTVTDRLRGRQWGQVQITQFTRLTEFGLMWRLARISAYRERFAPIPARHCCIVHSSRVSSASLRTIMKASAP